MSAADIDLVREAFDAYERAGVEALAQYFHPDFEGVVPPELSAEPDTYRGREGLRRYFALWEEQISDLGVAVEQLIDNDDAIVVPGAPLRSRARKRRPGRAPRRDAGDRARRPDRDLDRVSDARGRAGGLSLPLAVTARPGERRVATGDSPNDVMRLAGLGDGYHP
ncbi:MAG: nuclear transport factor 2 family protein [Solirubrobacterales bacterium]